MEQEQGDDDRARSGGEREQRGEQAKVDRSSSGGVVDDEDVERRPFGGVTSNETPQWPTITSAGAACS